MTTPSIKLSSPRWRRSLPAAGAALLDYLPTALLVLAVILGGLHTWAAMRSHSMNEDGIAYLDIGDAIWRGDWVAALNPVWSPLYAGLLGLVMRIVQPSMRWEFPLVHLVNFGVYLGALACFWLFWKQAGQYRRAAVTGGMGDSAWSTLSERAWWALGYVLFIWTSLSLIEVWAVTPDMLMACVVYLIGAILIRIRMAQAGWWTYVSLGGLLGLGYLAKAIMFPLALVFLCVVGLSANHHRRALPRVVVALVIFGLIAGAHIGAVSSAIGRVTFGDAGRLTYLRHVNGLPYPHWQGSEIGLGEPEHPSRQVLASPPVYEFATPVAGTYPIGHDPSYWYAGAVPRVDFRQQAHALINSGHFYLDLFLRQQAGLVLAAAIWYGLGGRQQWGIRGLVARWSLALPAVIAFGLYALVYVEGRYIAVFVTLLWADVLANVRWPAQPDLIRVSSWLSAGAVALLLANILTFNLEGFRALTVPTRTSESLTTGARAPSWPGEVAEALHDMGIRPGDRVGVIGYAFDSFWARLARVKIVAEMSGMGAGPFWMGDRQVQAQVVEAFALTGAAAIVAEDAPNYALLPGWRPVGETNYWVYLLGASATPSAGR